MTRVSRGTRATLSHVRGSATPSSPACRGASARAKQASQREEGYPESSVSRREDRCASQGSRRDGRGRGVVGRRAHLGGLGRPARCIRVLRRRYGRLHAGGASPGSRDTGRGRERHPCVDGGVCSSGGARLSRASADELGSRGERRLRADRQSLRGSGGARLRRRQRRRGTRPDDRDGPRESSREHVRLRRESIATTRRDDRRLTRLPLTDAAAAARSSRRKSSRIAGTRIRTCRRSAARGGGACAQAPPPGTSGMRVAWRSCARTTAAVLYLSSCSRAHRPLA